MTRLVEMATATHPGMVREHNEDCVVLDPDAAFAVLADGMGGHNAGEVASRIAADLVASCLKKYRGEPLVDARGAESQLAMHIREANAAVYAAAQAHAEYHGMGTTLVVAWWQSERVTVGHVGDSRVYRLRGQSLNQLTRDHSLVQEQLDRGAISRERARHALNRNVLTRAVGIDPQVDIDVGSYPLQREDIYLLCSDGLSDMLSDSEIRETLLSYGSDLNSAARRLVERANANGGLDNVSVVLVQVVGIARKGGA